ncbi:unnamed protein product [Amoebophrya sp. A25]|nr:unnamed protein product [Amoebophrya sp. A25]|eukprot:GSA25T00025481001.1
MGNQLSASCPCAEPRAKPLSRPAALLVLSAVTRNRVDMIRAGLSLVPAKLPVFVLLLRSGSSSTAMLGTPAGVGVNPTNSQQQGLFEWVSAIYATAQEVQRDVTLLCGNLKAAAMLKSRKMGNTIDTLSSDEMRLVLPRDLEIASLVCDRSICEQQNELESNICAELRTEYLDLASLENASGSCGVEASSADFDFSSRLAESLDVQFFGSRADSSAASSPASTPPPEQVDGPTDYFGVCCGGTFDALHFGHKILLTEALLLARSRLVIGLADGLLLKRKTLKELIAPASERKRLLRDFLETALPEAKFCPLGEGGNDPSLSVEIALINDPAGPAATDAGLNCIVLSAESAKGGALVNEERAKNRLQPLEQHLINGGNLLPDPRSGAGEEGKTSSSGQRMRLLGTLRRPQVREVQQYGAMFERFVLPRLKKGSATSNSKATTAETAGIAPDGSQQGEPDEESSPTHVQEQEYDSTTDFEQNKSSGEEESVSVVNAALGATALGVDQTQAQQSLSGGLGFSSSPYVIGLTGGSGSGKSSICRWLEQDHGAIVIDCDKLGQQAYAKPNSPCWKDLVDFFGADNILDPESNLVDRRKLGGIVFADKTKLEALNGIVWPHIQRMAYDEMSQRLEAAAEKDSYYTSPNTGASPATADPKQEPSPLTAFKQSLFQSEPDTLLSHSGGSGSRPVVVFDAAVLLEAKWACDEVWVVFVSREEQIRRIVDRDSKSEEEAAKRIDSQMALDERMKHADVLLSTEFEPEVTRSIVKKAADSLRKRIAMSQ